MCMTESSRVRQEHACAKHVGFYQCLTAIISQQVTEQDVTQRGFTNGGRRDHGGLLNHKINVIIVFFK